MFYNDTLAKVTKIGGIVIILICFIGGVIFTVDFSPLLFIGCSIGIALGVSLIAVSELLMRIDDLQLYQQEMRELHIRNEKKLDELIAILHTDKNYLKE